MLVADINAHTEEIHNPEVMEGLPCPDVHYGNCTQTPEQSRSFFKDRVR